MTSMSIFSNELSELLHTDSHTKKLEKGIYLFQEGTLATEFFMIKSGIIQLNKMNSDGRELTLKIGSKGDIIGESMLFSPNTRYMFDAKVMEEAEVTIIFKEVLEKKLSEDHSLALEFIKWMSIQQLKTQSKFRDLVLHGKNGLCTLP
jgi:CRP-like cAMP-binding protein